jgi:hypothetical protein
MPDFSHQFVFFEAFKEKYYELRIFNQTRIAMKQVGLVIHEPAINKLVGSELNLSLDDKASLVDAINEIDKLINNRGGFPLPDYRSFLHMVYNPIENRFYKQVAVTAHKELGQVVNVRDDPKRELPEGTTIILIPAGGCISEWEEAITHEEFSRAISHQQT